jgi:hypothetical protein
MSLSIYQDEPSILHILATAIASTTNWPRGVRSTVQVLGGGAHEILHKVNV